MAVSNISTGVSQRPQGFRSIEVLNRDNYVTWIEENQTLIKLALAQDVLNLFSSY